MKKLLSVFLSLISVICIAFAFVGCGGENSGDSGEVDAWIQELHTAYEDGWVDEDDLKSIACRQYECYEIAENPYAGAFTQQTEISAKAERDFKKVYCDKYRIDDPSEVEIVHYYGTYEGGVVVEVNRRCFPHTKRIGGVVFPDNDDKEICVLHYLEYSSEFLMVTGKLINAKTAYEKGWLKEDDLKSIACCCYDYANSEENPYSGLYTKPEDKLSKEMKSEIKDAYLRQIKGTWSTRLDDAYLHKYFGKYNGNIVVAISDFDCQIGIGYSDEIGGVSNNGWFTIYVYRLFTDGV